MTIETQALLIFAFAFCHFIIILDIIRLLFASEEASE